MPCAERLAALMPGAGHMVHMPGHIYIRVGRYNDAIMANEHAVHTDQMYMEEEKPGPGIYSIGYVPAQLPLPRLCLDHGGPEQGGDRGGEEDFGDHAVRRRPRRSARRAVCARTIPDAHDLRALG